MSCTNELLLAISPVIGLSFNVLAQVLLFRYRFIGSLLKSIFAGFIVGIFTINLIIVFANPEPLLPVLILNLFTYGSLGYGYFHFINLGETARRIRILREFRESNSMTEGELSSRYNAKEMIDRRVDRLLASGQIIQTDSELKLGRKSVLFMAQVINLLKIVTLPSRSRNRQQEFKTFSSNTSKF